MKILSLEDLQQVKQAGLAMTYPDKIKIVAGMATCGISAGADKVFEALSEALQRKFHLKKDRNVGYLIDIHSHLGLAGHFPTGYTYPFGELD